MLRRSSCTPAVRRAVPSLRCRTWSSTSRSPVQKYMSPSSRRALHPSRSSPSSLPSSTPTLKDLLEPLRKSLPPPPEFLPSTWEDLRLHDSVVKRLKELDLKEPTEIQKLGIPPIMRRDACVVLRAQTGTGKTLAFLLPVISHLRSQLKPKPFSALVLAPSRELVAQIATVTRKFAEFSMLSLIGGPDINEQLRLLKVKQPVVVLANPTRLQQILTVPDARRLIASSLEYLIVDELDHMVMIYFVCKLLF